VGGYEIRGIPETAYYRLISPELIPEYDKYLYSDVDVIFREDLSKYYNIDLKDNYFGAVSTCPELRPDYQEYLRKEYGMDWHEGYYYSGNLVINAAQIRKDRMMEEFRRLGKNNYHQQDMTIINLACRGRILAMTPAYCVSTPLYRLLTLQKPEMESLYGAEEVRHALSSGILHYNGQKPWKGPCPNMDVWWHYYRHSLVFDEQFTHDFWTAQRDQLVRLSLLKRLKLLLRYPIDRKQW